METGQSGTPDQKLKSCPILVIVTFYPRSKIEKYWPILLATPNEAETKAANEGGKVVAQFPLSWHEEGVQEGPCAIPGNDDDDDGRSGDDHDVDDVGDDGDDDGCGSSGYAECDDNADDVEHTEDNGD